MFTLLLALSAGSDPQPRFTVDNKADFVVRNRAGGFSVRNAACVCGDACKCKEAGKTCPGQCPVATAPAAKPKRVKLGGYWWDELPGNRFQWCLECNGPYPAGGVPGMVVVDWNGQQPRPQPAMTPRQLPYLNTRP